ncbi:MAG TPA: 50S ribosomal protein L17 [Patescibacteria group bacterium]|nr:50S ribosomal protein L17 [Patescibacteria group bacterium]
MRHRVKGKKLNRDASHRKALAKNLSTSLIIHKSLETTLAKAKFVRPYVERLVTKAKNDQSFTAIKYLRNKLTTESAVKTLLIEIAPTFKKRPGGYTRIIKLPERDGDKAKMARIEFIIEKPAKPVKKAGAKSKAEKNKEDK